MFKYILFDLDGTIINSAPGIINSIGYALEKLGEPVPGREALYKFLGPPLQRSFIEILGFSKEKTDRAVEYYRGNYREKGIYGCAVYPGVPELIKSLKAGGRTVVLATSKPIIFSEKILKNIGLHEYFDFISGSELDGSRVDKYEVIKYALDSLKIENPSEAVMTGDREHDIIGAKKAGIASIGVLYGYGSLFELQSAGADYVAADTEELYEFIMQNS
ncbi:MAG: HAD-IA family hydrolase [Oscillospiraceae bacterium]|nr:HAD-IA family hydrolase [Oscillospiraceae bacterium]